MKKSELKTVVSTLAQRVEILENSNKHYAQAINKHYQREVSYIDTINKLENQAEQLGEEVRELNSELSSRFDTRIDNADLWTLLYDVKSPINRIKIIRHITGWGLKEAKDWCDINLKGCVMQKFEEEEQV